MGFTDTCRHYPLVGPRGIAKKTGVQRVLTWCTTNIYIFFGRIKKPEYIRIILIHRKWKETQEATDRARGMSTLHVVAVPAKRRKKKLWMAKLQRRPLRTFIPRSRRVKVKDKVNANCLDGSWFQQILFHVSMQNLPTLPTFYWVVNSLFDSLLENREGWTHNIPVSR